MPWANVAANVQLPLKLANKNETLSRPAVTQSLDRVGLGDFDGCLPRGSFPAA